MCKFFMQSRCENGDTCSYAHDTEEVRTKPDLTRTSMCRNVQAKGICEEKGCRFAHDEAQLRATHGFFKMKMCGFAQAGRCKHGKNCRFAHSPDELRPPMPAPLGAEEDLLMAHLRRSIDGQREGRAEQLQQQPQPQQPPQQKKKKQQLPPREHFDGGQVGPPLPPPPHPVSRYARQAAAPLPRVSPSMSDEDERQAPPGQWTGSSLEGSSGGDGRMNWSMTATTGGSTTSEGSLMRRRSVFWTEDKPRSESHDPDWPAQRAVGPVLGSAAPRRQSSPQFHVQVKRVTSGGQGPVSGPTSPTVAPAKAVTQPSSAPSSSGVPTQFGDRQGQAGQGSWNENDSNSSWNTRDSGITEMPRSEHGGSPPTVSDSSSGAHTGSMGHYNVNLALAADSSTSTGVSGSGGLFSSSVDTRHSKEKRRQPKFGEGDNNSAAVTTLLITNVPPYLTQGALLSMFEDLTHAMRGAFDFFYCPWDEKAVRNLGYALINFPDPRDAAAFQQMWGNKELIRGGGARGQKPVKVMKAAMQGLQVNVEYFSKVEIAPCTDSRFRPLYRAANGKLQPLEPDTSKRQEPMMQVFDLPTVFPVMETESAGPRIESGQMIGAPKTASTRKSGTAPKQETWPTHSLLPRDDEETSPDTEQDRLSGHAAECGGGEETWGEASCPDGPPHSGLQGPVQPGVYQNVVPYMMISADMVSWPMRDQPMNDMKYYPGSGQDQFMVGCPEEAACHAVGFGNGEDGGTDGAANPGRKVYGRGLNGQWVHGMFPHLVNVPCMMMPADMVPAMPRSDGAYAADRTGLAAQTQNSRMAQFGGGWRGNSEVYSD
eukprot:CAMPEP_0170592444 /NCGR_PEP_ID=MMETSP0224-20130122/12927_1 /TAXON_ID=285029 /ORGANISM="Togula jolla, Strain CCCM 725" /LENGTH=821 /DNA_ID=CAMNT_0010916349 /DNA_START=161 /DNA_END=2626 /DNA_ORIENTATION=+